MIGACAETRPAVLALVRLEMLGRVSILARFSVRCFLPTSALIVGLTHEKDEKEGCRVFGERLQIEPLSGLANIINLKSTIRHGHVVVGLRSHHTQE